jgi:hemerythrin-like domain-containing protein
MSTTQRTDRTPVRQCLLPRQAAAPEGSVDVRLMYVMHHAFRRDLELFASAAAATPPGNRDTWVALARRWATFGEILHHHHCGEDAGLWPRLMQAATPEERRTLEDMETEHAGIDPVLTTCAGLFERMVSAPDADTAGRLAEALGAARDALFDHLRHEETEAMALVQKYLTTEEWQELEARSFRSTQFFRQLAATVPWALHELPQDAVEGLFDELGLPMRLLWHATRRRFERLDARARRHVS